MRKRYSLNLNWSERAQHRRAVLTIGGLALGGFAIGIILSVATDYLRPASIRQVHRASVVEHIPIYATPAPLTDADRESPSRSRPSIAEAVPPRNGTGALAPVDTDGRGGATTDGRSGGAVVSPKDAARARASDDRLKKIMQICRGC